MLSNDFAHGHIGKALLVITEKGRSVDACENRCLSRGALRTSFHTETWIGGNQNALVRSGHSFVFEDCERLCAVEPIERIVWPARADAEAIDEEEQD